MNYERSRNCTVIGKTLKDLKLIPVEVCQSNISTKQTLQFIKDKGVSDVPALDGEIFVGVASSSNISKR